MIKAKKAKILKDAADAEKEAQDIINKNITDAANVADAAAKA